MTHEVRLIALRGNSAEATSAVAITPIYLKTRSCSVARGPSEARANSVTARIPFLWPTPYNFAYITVNSFATPSTLQRRTPGIRRLACVPQRSALKNPTVSMTLPALAKKLRVPKGQLRQKAELLSLQVAGVLDGSTEAILRRIYTWKNRDVAHLHSVIRDSIGPVEADV